MRTIKFCANLEKYVMETLAMIRQTFREDERWRLLACYAVWLL
jgi:hypothetical protein